MAMKDDDEETLREKWWLATIKKMRSIVYDKCLVHVIDMMKKLLQSYRIDGCVELI